MSILRVTADDRRRSERMLRVAALVASLSLAVPAWAQSSEDLNSTELNRLTPSAQAAPTVAPQTAVPTAPTPPTYPQQGYASPPAYPQQGYASPPSYVDCNNPYYAQYCRAYLSWMNQYSENYNYGDAYPYYDYGYPIGVGVGLGFFGHRFDHGGRFHGGFHGGGFHGGHGGGFHGGGHGGGGHR